MLVTARTRVICLKYSLIVVYIRIFTILIVSTIKYVANVRTLFVPLNRLKMLGLYLYTLIIGHNSGNI